MKEKHRIIVLCFQFDSKTVFVIIHTLFYFLVNVITVLGIFVVWLVSIVYIVEARLFR